MPAPKKEAPETLMGNQDTSARGDSTRPGRKVPMSFVLDPALRDELRAYAASHRKSVSELIREGIEWRIRQER